MEDRNVAVTRQAHNTILCDDLDEAVDHYTNGQGYRLDMIVPADSPREALLSKDGESVRLVSEPSALAGGPKTSTQSSRSDRCGDSNAAATPPAYAGGSDWIVGRAGMEYRDLIPGRLGGKIIASHIRLPIGGEVPDYVHYHKVDFQMIYCKRGRIKVVYEDQGPPFWLETGDCVLQPPEIRHRVLECTAGAEVIEIGMPAVHETWVEHEIELPTARVFRNREFGGQRFVHHIAAKTERIASFAGGLLIRDTGILAASDELAVVWNLRLASDGRKRPQTGGKYAGPIQFYYILDGDLLLSLDGQEAISLKTDDCFVVPSLKLYSLDCSPSIELLRVVITKQGH